MDFKNFTPTDPNYFGALIQKVLEMRFPDARDIRIEYVVEEPNGNFRVGCIIEGRPGDQIVTEGDLKEARNRRDRIMKALLTSTCWNCLMPTVEVNAEDRGSHVDMEIVCKTCHVRETVKADFLS